MVTFSAVSSSFAPVFLAYWLRKENQQETFTRLSKAYPKPSDLLTMQVAKLEKINVIAAYAGFKTPALQRAITPIRFMLPDGEKHHVEEVKRSYSERVGDSLHVHFVIKTKERRYFDIVYDSKRVTWMLVVELEEALFTSQGMQD